MSMVVGDTSRRKAVSLTNEERSRHIHVLGASGTGKSKLLEAMIRQDIKTGRGLCLIDPHGTLADDVLQWCAATGMQDFRRIHIIEPADLGWTAGFNPLRLDGTTDPSVRVDAMVAACAQVWGGEAMTGTPLLKKCLRAVFYTLAVRGLTLAEAPFLTTGTNREVRQSLTADLPDLVFQAVWRDFEGLPRREFFEQFSSTNNRLMEFLSSPVVRRVVGQQKHALDLRAVMDKGEIVIVNLAHRGALSADNARLLGTLLTSELFLLALARDAESARRRPFTLYIDECYDFLTGDIEKVLDQTRKFGLHAVLSHQRLGQLGQFFNGVMAGAQTKIVFGGLQDDDAEVMAREVYRSSFNLERPKHVLDKPVVVDEVPYWLESEGWSENESTSTGTSTSSSWGSSSGGSESLSQNYDLLGRELGSGSAAGLSSSESYGGGSSSSESRSIGTGRSWGRSQTLKPVRQWLPTAVHSLEEELHLAIVKLRELPNQAAIVKRRGRPPVRVRPHAIKRALAGPDRVTTVKDACRRASPYLTDSETATSEIDARERTITGTISPTAQGGFDPFWVEEDA